MKILHFGDLHIWNKRFNLRDGYYPKRWLGLLNLALRRHRKFPPQAAERIMQHIAEADADTVLFSGDLSTMSLEEEFSRAAELFEPLHARWGDRLLVIPGNHDRYTPLSVRSRLYEKHMPYGILEHQIRSWDLEEPFRVIGFDASEPFMIRSNGTLRPEIEQELDQELEKAHRDEKSVILMGHFPFANPPEHPESWDHKLLGEERLAALVAKHKPLVYLHGHKHVRWALQTASTPDTLCLNCGSAGMVSSSPEKQAGYLTFELHPKDGVHNLTAHRLAEDGVSMNSGAIHVRQLD